MKVDNCDYGIHLIFKIITILANVIELRYKSSYFYGFEIL